MDTQERAQALLSAYGEIAGIADLRFEPHGCARLVFKGSVAVDLEIDHAGGCLQVYSVLGPVPAGGESTVFRRLLEGNLFGTRTGGATLAIDAVQGEILLCRRVDLEAHAVALAECLQSMADMAQHWRERLNSGELSAEPAGQTGEVPAGFYLRA